MPFTVPISPDRVWSLSVVQAIRDTARNMGLEPQELLNQLKDSQLQNELKHLPMLPALPTWNWAKTSSTDNMFVINTQFDPDLKANTRLKYKSTDLKDRIEATQKHRMWAGKAKTPKNAEDCAKMVCDSQDLNCFYP